MRPPLIADLTVKWSPPLSTWMRSVPLHLLVFWLPISFAVLFYFGAPSIDRDTYLLWFLIGVLICDLGHTLPTFLLIYGTAGNGFPRFIKFIPALVLPLNFLLALTLGPEVFIIIFAYLTLLHVVRQQAAWLSFAKNEPTLRPSWTEKLALHFLMLYPILHWHSDNSALPNDYMRSGDLALAGFIKTSALTDWLYVSIFALSMAHVLALSWKAKRILWYRFSVLASTFVWFGFGLLIATSGLFFFTCTTLIHGLSYHFHVVGTVEARSKGLNFFNFNKSRLLNMTLYLLLVIVFGVMLYYGGKPKFLDTLGTASIPQILFMAALFAPAMSHYFIDTIIWKRRFRTLPVS